MKPILTRRLALEFGLLVWGCVMFRIYFTGQSPITFGFPWYIWKWLGVRGRLVFALILLVDLAAAVVLVALYRGRSVRGRDRRPPEG